LKDSGESLKFLHRFHAGDKAAALCSRFDQESFVRNIPKNVELVVFLDVEAWSWSNTKEHSFDVTGVSTLASRLNARGVATLLFCRSLKKPFQTDFIPYRNQPNFVWLAPDPATLTEYGGGFGVFRNKLDESDPVPTNFRFWYSTLNGKLDSGWVLVNDTSSAAIKKVAMQERLLKVEELVREGMPQKDISVVLGVDPATVSRDVSRLRQNGISSLRGS
jgi:DNA-binding CsgD family transcriptional regulator